MQRQRRALIIVNPLAVGLPRRADLVAAVGVAASEFGLEVTLAETEGPGHATTLASEAEHQGAEIIFVAGGDGALNETINGLRGDAVAVGVLPAGTANVWAKEAGITRDPLAALRAQLQQPAMLLDVGRAGERRFLLMASYGLDAEAVAAVRAPMKRRLGRMAYVVAGGRVGLRYSGFHVSLSFDDDAPLAVEAAMMLFGNTRLYGGVRAIASEASAVDGMLDCVVFLGRGPRAALRMLSEVARKRQLRSPAVLFLRARRVRMSAATGVELPAMQLDGDAVAAPAADLWVEPRALRMFVPRGERAVFQPLGG